MINYAATTTEGRTVDLQAPNRTHCTMYFKRTPGPDRYYASRFFSKKEVILQLTNVYWSVEGFCASACCISPEEQVLFREITPHISLAKPKNKDWRDVGGFVKECQDLRDWAPVGLPDLDKSKSMGYLCHKPLGRKIISTPSAHMRAAGAE